MNGSKVLALIGAATLFFGVFTPIASAPLIGDMTLFSHGTTAAIVLILLALAGGWLALTEREHVAAWAGGAALAVLAIAFYLFERKIGEMRSHFGHGHLGRLLRGFADMAIDTVQLQWGWAVMGLGALLLICAGVLAFRQSEAVEEIA